MQGAASRVQEVRETLRHQSPEERRHCGARRGRQVCNLSFFSPQCLFPVDGGPLEKCRPFSHVLQFFLV